MYFDEIDAILPWSVFGSLRDLTLYWPTIVFDLESGKVDQVLCEQTEEDLLVMLGYARDYEGKLPPGGFMDVLRALEEPVPSHISVTLKLEAPHNHYTLEELQGEGGHELNKSADYFNLKITCSYDKDGLKLLSTECNGQILVPGSWSEVCIAGSISQVLEADEKSDQVGSRCMQGLRNEACSTIPAVVLHVLSGCS